MNDRSDILFRASSCGALMIGPGGLTDNQASDLRAYRLRRWRAYREAQRATADVDRLTAELESRERGLELSTDKDEAKLLSDEIRAIKQDITLAKRVAVKPLTDNMRATMNELFEKKRIGYQLSETTKRMVEEIWLKDKYGYDEPVVTNEMLKGHMCEQDSIGLVQKVYGGDEFRVKNTKGYQDEVLIGTPDVVLSDLVEDVKTSWDIRTFFQVRKIPELYYAQAQAYMRLTGRRKFALHYCLVDTPESLILDLERRFWYRFECNDDNPYYQEICRRIRRNHSTEGIPESDRIKTFRFEYDEDYICELVRRAEVAREYYSELTLNAL